MFYYEILNRHIISCKTTIGSSDFLCACKKMPTVNEIAYKTYFPP